MWICFVDESGDPGVLPRSPAKGDPSALLVLMAVAARAEDLRPITRRLLELKSQWPHVRGYSSRVLDRIDCDLKGSSLRAGWQTRAPAATQQLAATVTDGAVSLLEEFRTPIFGKVFVKHPGGTFDGQRLYNMGLAHICEAFQALLDRVDDHGIVVVDSRNEGKNRATSHSIFTRKFAAADDSFSRLLDVPTYADSKNHAGLQLADWVASSLIAPMALDTYCQDSTPCPEWDAGYERLTTLYRDRLRKLQFAARSGRGWKGAIKASDWRGGKPANAFMKLPADSHLAALLAGDRAPGRRSRRRPTTTGRLRHSAR